MGFPSVSSGKKICFPMQDTQEMRFYPWVGKIPWRRAWQPTPVFLPGEFSWTEEPGGLKSWTRLSNWAHWANNTKCLSNDSLAQVIRKLGGNAGFWQSILTAWSDPSCSTLQVFSSGWWPVARWASDTLFHMRVFRVELALGKDRYFIKCSCLKEKWILSGNK